MLARTQKISSELLTLTYGALVSQVVKNSENIAQANDVLQKIGYNIGLRIVDEYMAKTNVCNSFDQVVQSFAKGGLKMFLGVTGEVKDYIFQIDKKQKNLYFNLIINQNPLLNFVQLPSDMKTLQYQNIVCGILRGAFFTLNLKGKVFVAKDSLKSPNQPTIIRVQMKKQVIKSDDD